MIQRRIITSFFICIALSIFIIWKRTERARARAQSSNTASLVIGTAAGYAPFVSINAQGAYEGFDIDVAQHVANRMGKTLVIKDLGSMSALFMALDNGSIDAIIWGLSITSQRTQYVAMVHYQGSAVCAYPLLFWQQIPNGISRLEDMSGKTVCVEPGSSQAAVLEQYPAITIRATEKVDDALLNIQYGKADAALVEPAIARKFKDKYPQIQELSIALKPDDCVQGVGIAIKKDNLSLIHEIEQAVSQLKKAGTIEELAQKWNIE